MHALHICVCSHNIQTVQTFGGGIQAPGVLLYIWLMAFWRITACWVRLCRYSELSLVLLWFSPTYTCSATVKIQSRKHGHNTRKHFILKHTWLLYIEYASFSWCRADRNSPLLSYTVASRWWLCRRKTWKGSFLAKKIQMWTWRSQQLSLKLSVTESMFFLCKKKEREDKVCHVPVCVFQGCDTVVFWG